MAKTESNSSTKNKDVIEKTDFKDLDLKSLAIHFEKLFHDERWRSSIKKIQDLINTFELKYKNEIQLIKSKFIKNGEDEIDFNFYPDYKIKFDQILKEFKIERQKYYKERDNVQKNNLDKKLEVIEELKGLINVDENINAIYKKFKNLQESWHKIGAIPISHNLNVWNTYKHHVEIFYDFLHLNRELRDLDFKHNYNEKIKIIEQAEALTELKDIVKASRDLNSLHRLWKNELGPVAKEHSEKLWNRFQKATKLIHSRRQEYFKNYENVLKKNLEKKLTLLKKMEEMKNSMPDDHRGWQKFLIEHNKIKIEFQQISPLRKKENKKTWAKFRIINKDLNRNKNTFFKKQKLIQKNNLKNKTDLIERVKEILEKENWSNYDKEIKSIQKKWTEIGFVSKKLSSELWKEFNLNCNLFFDRLKQGHQKLSKEEEKIVKKKDDFISTLDKEKIPGKVDKLNEFINQKWENFNSIGKLKDAADAKCIKSFSSALSRLIDDLKLEKMENESVKFNIKLLSIEKNPKKIRNEATLLKRKIKDIDSEVLQLENNIDFFSNSSSENPILKNVSKKISSLKVQSDFWNNRLLELTIIEKKD